MVYALAALALLAVAVIVTIRSNASMRELAKRSGLSGSETGTFETYLARIEQLAREGYDSFFVTAVEQDGPRFVQVSVGRGRDGTLEFEFDIPSVDWSHPYIGKIAAEAEKRGRHAEFTGGTSGMQFLDIVFATSGDHAVFARWVVAEVFGHTRDTRYEIEWG